MHKVPALKELVLIIDKHKGEAGGAANKAAMTAPSKKRKVGSTVAQGEVPCVLTAFLDSYTVLFTSRMRSCYF